MQNVSKALEALVEIIEDRTVEPHVRLTAIQLLLDFERNK